MRLIERQKNIEQDKNIKEENIEQLWLFRNISFNIHTFLYHFIFRRYFALKRIQIIVYSQDYKNAKLFCYEYYVLFNG